MMAIPVTVAIVLMNVVDVAPLIGAAFPATLISFMVYVPLGILSAFNLSYCFDDPDTCQSQLPPLLNMAGRFLIIARMRHHFTLLVMISVHLTFYSTE